MRTYFHLLTHEPEDHFIVVHGDEGTTIYSLWADSSTHLITGEDITKVSVMTSSGFVGACGNCGKDVNCARVCLGCCLVVYCNRACQKNDWVRNHRQECVRNE